MPQVSIILQIPTDLTEFNLSVRKIDVTFLFGLDTKEFHVCCGQRLMNNIHSFFIHFSKQTVILVSMGIVLRGNQWTVFIEHYDMKFGLRTWNSAEYVSLNLKCSIQKFWFEDKTLESADKFFDVDVSSVGRLWFWFAKYFYEIDFNGQKIWINNIFQLLRCLPTRVLGSFSPILEQKWLIFEYRIF